MFCLDPGMRDVDYMYMVIRRRIPEWYQRQLAAVILPSLPTMMGQIATSSLPFGAYGLDVLRHVGPTMELLF